MHIRDGRDKGYMCSLAKCSGRVFKPSDVEDKKMELFEQRERLDVKNSDLSGSLFFNVTLSGSTFKNINISGASFEDANMSGWRLNDVNLSGMRLANANLEGVMITDSLVDGMTINGVAVTDLLAAYRTNHG